MGPNRYLQVRRKTRRLPCKPPQAIGAIDGMKELTLPRPVGRCGRAPTTTAGNNPSLSWAAPPSRSMPHARAVST
jgi:hypothetical protein